MLAPVVLAGIAAGASVFVATIVAVYFLLMHGGSFDRMRSEAAGLPLHPGELKPLLYDELLEKARTMALKPALLQTPLSSVDRDNASFGVRDFDGDTHAELLFQISSGKPQDGIYRGMTFDADEMIWRHLAHGPFATSAAFRTHYCAQQAPDERHYVLTSGDVPIGMVTLSAHAPRDLRVQIDALWLTPAFQGSGALAATMLLLLTHLFETVGYRRVEWRCDGHNERARRAAHSLGFAFDGLLRKHRIVKQCNSDSALFAAINSDWPAMKDQLEQKVQLVVTTTRQSDATTTSREDKKQKSV